MAEHQREVVLRGANGDREMVLVAFPLSRGDELLGVLTLEAAGLEEPNFARLRSAVEAVAANLLEQIRGARLERASRRQSQVTEIVARLGAQDERDELCATAADEVTLLLEAQDAVLRLRDARSGRFRIVAWSGVGAWREARLARLEKTLAADCIRGRESIRVSDLGAAEGAPCGDAAMALPLIRNGRAIGSISVLGKVPEEPLLGECFDGEDEGLLGQLGQHFLTALSDLSEQGKSIEDEAHDAATGLPGAAVFRARLEEEVARSARREHSLVLFSIHLRGLEALCDEGRGEEADEVAGHIAAALRDALRPFDVVGRRGPDQFDALVPEPDAAIPDIATALGRALRSALDLHPDATAGIDFSLGYAVYPDDGEEPDDLLARSDQARIDAL